MLTNNLKLVFLVAVLTALSFNYAFNFHLFLDDWYQILGSLYYPEILKGYLSIHPVSVLEFRIFSPIFKFNPYYWQFLGYLLRVIDALSTGILILALTKSKVAANYSAIIFATFVIGIESVIWPSPHSSAIVIPLINIGFYFWIKSQSLINKNYFYGLALFSLAILAEPGRAIMIIFLAPLWELLSVYQKFNVKSSLISLLKLIPLFLMTGIITFIVKQYFSISTDFSVLSQGLMQINLNSIILSLENPLFGWTLIPQKFLFLPTIIFLIVTAILFLLFIWKKLEIYKITFFLCIWIPLFFLPNFLTQSFARAGLGVESRYYVISAIGIVGLISYGLSLVKSKKIKWLLIIFLIFNIYVNNSILKRYYVPTRSITLHDKIWNKIDADVPKDEKFSIFIFSGENFTQRTSLLDWQDSIPFAVKRGIVKKDEYPIVTNNKVLISKLICEKNVIRHSPFGNLIQKEPIPLSHIHAWELKNGELIDRSETERGSIKMLAKCLTP